jgi:hypothetical protein
MRNVIFSLFKYLAAGVVLLWIFGSVMSGCEEAADRDRRQALADEKAAAAKVAADQGRARCATERAAIVRTYGELIEAGKGKEAADAVAPCALLLKDQQLKEMEKTGRLSGWAAAAADPKLSLADRIAALDQIDKATPGAKVESLAALRVQLEAAKTKEDRANQAQRERAAKEAERARLAQAKREGVRIGMSKQQVLESSWGRPEKINTTTNVYGTREQWVYGGGYLYFTGDTLTSIQN